MHYIINSVDNPNFHIFFKLSCSTSQVRVASQVRVTSKVQVRFQIIFSVLFCFFRLYFVDFHWD